MFQFAIKKMTAVRIGTGIADQQADVAVTASGLNIAERFVAAQVNTSGDAFNAVGIFNLANELV